jgi:hypothetical protein
MLRFFLYSHSSLLPARIYVAYVDSATVTLLDIWQYDVVLADITCDVDL